MSKTHIPENYLDLLDEPIVVQLATVMPDGQPQVTPVWADRVGNNIRVNTAIGRQKDRNLRARPMATVAVFHPDNPYRYLEVRGRIVETIEGQAAHDHIQALSHSYFGREFKYNTEGEQRVIFIIEPTRVHASG